MTEKMEKMVTEIQDHREEIIDKLVQFSLTDMLLFWGQEKDLIETQEKIWKPILQWVQKALDAQFKVTHGIEVSDGNNESGHRLKIFLNELTDRELVAFYMAALDMRSVLLAAALIKGRINAEQAFEAAFLEELWQAKNWGSDDEAENRRAGLKQELMDVEAFLKKDKV